jgi:hypothetical protein
MDPVKTQVSKSGGPSLRRAITIPANTSKDSSFASL